MGLLTSCLRMSVSLSRVMMWQHACAMLLQEDVLADCLAELRRQRQVAIALMLSGQRLEAAVSGTQESHEQSQQAAACAAMHTTIQVRRRQGAMPCNARWPGLSWCSCSAERVAVLTLYTTGGGGGCHSQATQSPLAAPILGLLV